MFLVLNNKKKIQCLTTFLAVCQTSLAKNASKEKSQTKYSEPSSDFCPKDKYAKERRQENGKVEKVNSKSSMGRSPFVSNCDSVQD